MDRTLTGERPAGMLENVRIVEIAGGLAVSIAGLMLAEMGAEVVRIEPPEGDPARGTAQFAVVNRSKSGVVLNLSTADGRQSLEALLAGADLLIHDLPSDEVRRLSLDAEVLDRMAPALITVAISAFPSGHPLADLPRIDMLALGAAGVLDEQAAVRRDGPVFLRFPLGSWGAGLLAAVGALAKLVGRGRGGAAGSIETSLVQGALTSLAMHWYRAEKPSQSLIDGLPKRSESTLFECADGVWLHIMANADHVPMMADALEKLPAEYREPIPPTTTYAKLFPLLPGNRKAFLEHASEAWLEALWAADVPVQPVLPMGALYSDPQALVNDFVVEVDDPVFGRCRQPALPVTLDPPAQVRSAALPPTGDVPDWPRPALAEAKQGQIEPHRPLAGTRILDLGNFLAGPFAMMLAADLGADVVKVEATTGDQMRWIDWGFNGCQRGKRSLALQLKDPAARAVLERLVAGADVVHHNLRMPAARKLGLDYETLRAINSELIYCHVNSYGGTGPRKDWPGYDQLFQACSGWELEAAGLGNRPVWMRFGMMDHLAAMASLCATLAALRRRERTGEGACVGASLMAAAMLTMSETVRRADGSLTPFPRLDADQTGIGPRQRLYRCADGWIALSCESDESWERLAAGGDIAPALAAMRVGDARTWVCAGGAVAVHVREDQHHAFLDDPDMQAAGLVASYPHPIFGKLEQVGSFWRLDGRACRLDRAPPTLGQHSRAVLAEIGYAASEIDALVEAGVVLAG